MIAIFCLVLSFGIAWMLLSPHLSEADQSAVSYRSVNLDDQRSRCVQVIHDLELDYATGKIGQGDYEDTRQVLSAELGSILRNLDEAK